MSLNVPGLIVMAIFYLLILGTGIWASMRSKKVERKCTGSDGMEITLLAGRNTNRLFWEPLKINDIKWNFEKFLVGPDGKPVMRWFPRVPVSEVREDILKYIRQLFSQSTQQNID